MKIQIHTQKNNLIYDSIKNEYSQYIQGSKPDIVWSLSSDAWKTLGTNTLKNNKIVFGLNTIDKDEFDRNDFLFRDNFAAAYYVNDKKTKTLIEKLTFKPVHLIICYVETVDTFENLIIENFKSSPNFASCIMDIFKEIKE